jgi:cytochrome c biogenesis protein CcmG/thiol:disulfide interchange protein DsbE
MAKFFPLMIVPPAIFGAFVLLAGVGMFRDDPNGLPSVFVGRQAPELNQVPLLGYPSFDSTVFSKEGVKLVNFWASWCAPCRAEHPNLIKLSEEFPVYGVNQDYTEADADKFLNELGNPFLGVVYDGKKQQSLNWGVYGLPETFVIDGEGIVVKRIVGPLTQRVIEKTLRPAIDAALQGPSE